MNFSITPNTYEPENAYDLKIYDNILPKVTHTNIPWCHFDDRLSWEMGSSH